MDLMFSEEDLAFREEVRTFIRENLPADIAEATRRASSYVPKEFSVRWHKILHQRGWVAMNWPVEHGGTGWTPVQKYIFDQEYQSAGCPRLSPFGLTMVGPVIMEFGTVAQKDTYLPKILSAEHMWCQGYSEPGAGSDLASLKTKAELDEAGATYIVNGQKIWTSHAHYADMIFCLVRTSTEGKRQEGITFLLIDMKSAGLEVRPIVSIDGGHYLNEVFFRDVEVPVENRIGEENKGWTYAKFLLGHERTGIAGVAKSKRKVEKIKEIAAIEQSGGAPLIEDGDFRTRLAKVEIELSALEYTNLRTMTAENAGQGPGPEASILKIRGTQIEQELNEIFVNALGHYAIPVSTGRGWPPPNEPTIGPDYAVGRTEELFLRRAASIYGGSNEIQKNIIAKAILGLTG